MYNQLLTQTNQVKYLVLYFDTRLTWKDHDKKNNNYTSDNICYDLPWDLN